MILFFFDGSWLFILIDCLWLQFSNDANGWILFFISFLPNLRKSNCFLLNMINSLSWWYNSTWVQRIIRYWRIFMTIVDKLKRIFEFLRKFADKFKSKDTNLHFLWSHSVFSGNLTLSKGLFLLKIFLKVDVISSYKMNSSITC